MSELTLLGAALTCPCRFAAAGAHHDELLRAPSDVAIALDLFELALTWDELDYSAAAVIPPTDWLEFARQHPWRDPDMAQRLFSAAWDIAARRRAVPGPVPTTKEETQ